MYNSKKSAMVMKANKAKTNAEKFIFLSDQQIKHTQYFLSHVITYLFSKVSLS